MSSVLLSTSSSFSSFSVGSRCGLTRSELDAHHWVTEEGYCKALCGDGSKCGDPYAKHAAAGPALPSSPNSKSSSQSSSSSDASGEYTLRIHSSDVELIHRGTASKLQRLRHERGSMMGAKQILAEIAAINTHLEKSEAQRIAAETQLKQAQSALLTERQQRETERVKLETELKQVMAHLHQKEQTLASAQGATTDQGNTSNQQLTHHTAKQEQKHGSSFMSRFRAWRSPSRRRPSHTSPASSPLSVPSSPPATPPHPPTTSAVSSPLSTQPMSLGTAVAVSSSSSSPQCPVCHEPIDDDLYEMVGCGHFFHLACARFVWKQQHGREDTPFCIFPHCGAPVKHSPTKRLARIVEESSSRSNSASHRSIGQTNPSLDRQSIGSQDTVVSQATTTSTSTESNQPQPQPQTNMTPNTLAFSSSSSSSNSASTSTSAFTQEHKQPPTMDTSTVNAPASSSDA